MGILVKTYFEHHFDCNLKLINILFYKCIVVNDNLYLQFGNNFEFLLNIRLEIVVHFDCHNLRHFRYSKSQKNQLILNSI